MMDEAYVMVVCVYIIENSGIAREGHDVHVPLS